MSTLTLRLLLPPATLDPQSNPLIRFAGFDRRRQAVRHGEMPLLSLLSAFPGARFEGVLHPEDSSIAWVQLPPVAPSRMKEAVLGAVEPLLLDPLEEQAIAYGARQSHGRVTVAWASRLRLQQLLLHYAKVGCVLQALYPAALNVPPPPEGLAIDRRDDTLLLRDASGQGHEMVLDPLSPNSTQDALAQLRDWSLFREASPLHLYPAVADFPWESLGKTLIRHEADQAWSAEPGLSLALPDLLPQQGLSRLSKKNLAWLAATAALLIIGLNLHAHRLNKELQPLHASMTQLVRQTYPQLPIVVDPLKQAQQQHAALLGQTGQWSEADFIPLSLAAAELFPDLNNQVRRLHYQAGELTLELAPSTDRAALGAVKETDRATTALTLSEAQQKRAATLNLMVEAQGNSWRIRSSQNSASSLSTR